MENKKEKYRYKGCIWLRVDGKRQYVSIRNWNYTDGKKALNSS